MENLRPWREIANFGVKFQNLAQDNNVLNDEPSNNLLRIASLVPKLSLSCRRVDSYVQFRIFADIGSLLRQWGCVMIALDVFIYQESISLYKKLLADCITDRQRDVIGKMLAEEEAKLLDLLSPEGRHHFLGAQGLTIFSG